MRRSRQLIAGRKQNSLCLSQIEKNWGSDMKLAQKGLSIEGIQGPQQVRHPCGFA